MKKLPFYTYLYFLCQVINVTAAVISVSVVAAVGLIIAPNSVYATIPYGMQFLAVFLMTYPASIIMQKAGRKYGFLLGALLLATAGFVGFWAVQNTSFIGLILAHVFLGLFVAIANYYRFAVTDNIGHELKSRALSFVVAGGVLAALLAPMLVRTSKELGDYQAFSLCYALLVALALINILLIGFLPNTVQTDDDVPSPQQHVLSFKGVKQNTFITAVISAAVGVGMMNLIMIQSSLHMTQINIEFDKSSAAIQWHVLAMFVPSFFTGYLLDKLGHIKVITIGFTLFIASLGVNYFAVQYPSLVIALILLGLAWNFTFIGGSALLTLSYQSSDCQQKLQGVNDTLVAIAATIGAFSPSILNELLGWKATNLSGVSLCLISLFLVLWLNKPKIGSV